MMQIEEQIRERLNAGLELQEVELINESHMHSGDRMDTHFKLVAVSAAFSGLKLIQRHQKIYGLMGELMRNPIHALTMHLYTPEEWAARAQPVPDSPNCMGGSKRS